MNPPRAWTPELIERLHILVRNGHSFRQISIRLGINRTSLTSQLRALSLQATTHPDPKPAKKPRQPKPKPLAVVTFPQFTDHPNGDSDRHRGRKPLPGHQCSLTGNAAAMCVG